MAGNESQAAGSMRPLRRAIASACFIVGLLAAGHCSAAEPDAAGANPLERAVNGMRTAGERISARDTGAATRDVQRHVVNDLKQLIDMARRQQNQPRQPSQPQPQPQFQPEPSPSSGPTQSEQQSASPPANEPGDASQNRQKPADSEERVGNPSDEQVQTLTQRRLVREVWGHLPARLREKLQNVSSEKTLPQYEDLVRRYFEALAEEDSGQAPH